MITFVCCLIALIVGYFIYGKFIERIFGIDAKRQTPAYTHQDGVDYIPMPTWKVFMIQFLNIAGLGPIFGAHYGSEVRNRFFPVDRVGKYLCRFSTRLPVRDVVPAS